MLLRALLVTACLVVASQARAQPSASPLLEVSKQYSAAFNACDIPKIVSFYAENAVVISPNTPPVKGVKAIEAYLRKSCDKYPAGVAHVAATPLDSRVSGELGYLYGEYVTTVKRPSGQTAQWKGPFLVVYTQVNGAWKILYDSFSLSAPPEPPAAQNPPAPPTPRQ